MTANLRLMTTNLSTRLAVIREKFVEISVKNSLTINSKSLSLTELVIAIALLGTVFAAATSFNIASYNFYYSSDKLVETQLAISPAMEMVVKNASLVVGDIPTGMLLSEGFFFGLAHGNYQEVHMRLDLNSPPTPNNYNDDTWVGFWRDEPSNSNDLIFCGNCNPNVSHCNGTCATQTLIKGRLLDWSQSGIEGFKITDRLSTNGCIDISITGRYNPSLSADPLTNPEVNLTSTVCPSGLSLK